MIIFPITTIPVNNSQQFILFSELIYPNGFYLCDHQKLNISVLTWTTFFFRSYIHCIGSCTKQQAPENPI